MNHVPAVVIIFLPDIIITTATMKLALSLALVSSAAAFTAPNVAVSRPACGVHKMCALRGILDD